MDVSTYVKRFIDLASKYLNVNSLQAAAALCNPLIVRRLEVSDLSLGGFIIKEKKNDFRTSSHH